GYLADRLARLGVEKALADAGAEPGDTVLIGDLVDAVVFDWDPTLTAGGGHAPGPRGSDWRLEGGPQGGSGGRPPRTRTSRSPRGPWSRSVPPRSQPRTGRSTMPASRR